MSSYVKPSRLPALPSARAKFVVKTLTPPLHVNSTLDNSRYYNDLIFSTPIASFFSHNKSNGKAAGRAVSPRNFNLYRNNSYLYGNKSYLYGNKSFPRGNDSYLYGNNSYLYGNKSYLYGNDSYLYGNKSFPHGNDSDSYGSNLMLSSHIVYPGGSKISRYDINTQRKRGTS
jgi:hypothetical protein